MDADRTLQNPDNSESELIAEVRQIVQAARNQSYRAINVMQIVSNWLIGQRIVVQEQMGKDKADYGKHVIEIVSAALTEEFGKGYSETNIKSMRKFYLIFSNLQIRQALPAELKRLIYQKGQALPAELESTIPLFPQLSWTHYERLMRVENETARLWYLNESAKQMWSYRTLDRNISTQYYERLLLSQKKEPVIAEMQEKTADFQKDRLAYIKNPIIAEFLGLQQQPSLHESTLEEAIINNLQQFLMELGKGFAFVARQQHLRTEENDYFIDLVFYNYILKCFVLIDLKTNKLNYQDVGQMDMYLQLYDQLMKQPDDNPTIGIILCSDTDSDVVRFSSLSKNEQLYASKYKLYLPTEEELRREIERQKELYYLKQENK
jgi:predicted nuclease of restriction endonuclease-like (RecB) superfamily